MSISLQLTSSFVNCSSKNIWMEGDTGMQNGPVIFDLRLALHDRNSV